MNKTMALIAAMILTGCDAGSIAVDEPGSATALSPDPGPDPAVLADRGLGTGSLPETQLLATPRGRDLLSRVVSCALPPGATITTLTRDGTPYSFAGAFGLAPGWAIHAPSADERRRVIACASGRARRVPRVGVRTPTRNRRGSAARRGSCLRTAPRGRT